MVLMAGMLMAEGCGFGWLTHPKDYQARSYGKLDTRPDVLVRLSISQVTCARRDGTANVVIFVNLYNLPPQEIQVVVNGQLTFTYHGDSAILDLRKVGYGHHWVEVLVPGYRKEAFRTSWTVYACPDLWDDPLRRPDGTLKGYE